MLKMTADQLRDRIAAAARTVQLRLGPNSLAIATGGGTVPLSGGEAYDVADAVLAEVQPELDRLQDRAYTAGATGLREYAEALPDGDPRIPGLLDAAHVLLAARTAEES